MTSRKVSVIIPTYNRPHLLEQCISSLLSQTSVPDEVIVVNDGSTVDYRSTMEKLSSIAGKIRYHHPPSNNGVGAARNFGLDCARGEFVVFLDDDDLLGSNLLETSRRRLMDDSAVHVVVTGSRLFMNMMTETPPEAPASLLCPRRLESDPFTQILLHGLVVGSCMLRRSALENLRFHQELKFGEDLFLWLQLAADGNRFKFNEDAYTYVRRHPGNTTQQPDVNDNIVKCYQLLAQSPLIKARNHRFIVHGRLMMGLLRQGNPGFLRHMAHLLRHPDLIPPFLWQYLDIRLKIWRNERRLKSHECPQTPPGPIPAGSGSTKNGDEGKPRP